MKLRPFIIIDEHLILHLARPELAVPLFEAVDSQQDYLRQWLPWVDGTKQLQNTKDFLEESMRYNTDGTRLTTFILLDETVAGSIGVVGFNKDNKSCEVGYWLSKSLQGRGIMTKACAVLIDHLFSVKDLNRIEIKVAEENKKSQAIPLRLGFVHEGKMRQGLYIYKEYHDLELFSLLKEDWSTKKGG